jgi:hypothetical protein
MAKKKRSPEPAAPTKRQAYASRRERRTQRVVLLIFAGLIPAAVIGVLVYGLLFVPGQAIAVVNGETITIQEFRNRVRLQYYLQIESQAELQGVSFEEVERQASIDIEALGENTLNNMISEMLLRQAADEMGVVVDEADVDDMIRQFLEFQPVGESTTVSTPFPTSAATTPTATSTFVYTLTPSPTVVVAYAQETPTGAVTPTPTPDLVPTEAETDVTPTATHTPQGPTHEDEAAFRQAYDERLSEWKEASGMSEAEIRQLFAIQAILSEAYDEIAATVPTTTDQVRFGSIVVGTVEEGIAVLARLDAGESFAEVAAQVSLDTTTAYRGGEVDWVSQNLLEATAPELSDLLFSLSVGEHGGPIQSPEGFLVVTVYDRAEDVPLPGEALLYQHQQEYQLFVAGLTPDAAEELEINENWRQFLPNLG